MLAHLCGFLFIYVDISACNDMCANDVCLCVCAYFCAPCFGYYNSTPIHVADVTFKLTLLLACHVCACSAVGCDGNIQRYESLCGFSAMCCPRIHMFYLHSM
ncbi:unnamed protein product, partial [Discosporangium mesarthrocarpum]